jgi:hypothetical protein
MKPLRNNHPSDTIYQVTINIPYIKGISEKFRHIGNCFSVRITFKTVMKSGPVRDAQEMKQCVYNIPYDCGKCYINERSRPLELHNKEHKYNLTQGPLE